VNDTSCRFIKGILERDNGFGTSYEVIESIFIDNYCAVMQGKSLLEEKKHQAQLIVKQKVQEILNSELFLQPIVQNQGYMKWLVFIKEEQIVKE
jgi:hypothetical protein